MGIFENEQYVMKNFHLINRHFRDLNPIQFGYEQCRPQKRFGPYIRKHTLIHYVVKGKGVLWKNGLTFPVQAGEAFLILPGETATYEADATDPWYYQWVGFDGALAENFQAMPPVFPFPHDILQRMIDAAGQDLIEHRIAGLLFHLYAELFEEKRPQNNYVGQVQSRIHASYMEPLRVEQIAEELNLNRRYLSRVFKQKTGRSIQEYLIFIRMEEAKRRLEEGYSVKETATLCGYDDVGNFSKMFKRVYGSSPLYWKK